MTRHPPGMTSEEAAQVVSYAKEALALIDRQLREGAGP